MMKLLALLAVAALTVVAFSPADPAPPPPAHTWEVFQTPEFRDRPNGVELR